MQIIINGDDFGRSLSINQAVIKAHREGILTSASLMVAGEAFDEAVALALTNPSLAVGLHLVVISGQAALPSKVIPHLVDKSGRFPETPVRNGLLYFFSSVAKRELAMEVEAQFDRFASSGLPLSHVDGHLHMHMHPSAFRLLLSQAEKHGAKGLRIPRDDLRLGLSYDRSHMVTKTAWAVIFGLLSRWGLSQMQAQSLCTTQRVYGLMQSGQMKEDYVLNLIQKLDVPTAEIYFHPDTQAHANPLGPNPGDLQSLLSPRVRSILQDRGIRRVTYPLLQEGSKC